MKPILYCFVLSALLVAGSGCQSLQPSGLPAEFSDAARMVATSIADQGVLQKATTELRGQVIEPGFETWAGVKYIAGARLLGFSGQIGLASESAGSGGLSDEARNVVVELADRPDLLIAWFEAQLELERLKAGISAKATAPGPATEAPPEQPAPPEPSPVPTPAIEDGDERPEMPT